MLTGYAVAKKINELLAAHNIKQIPPQMIYNYMRNNMIPSTEGRVSIEDAAAFAQKYVSKKLALVS